MTRAWVRHEAMTDGAAPTARVRVRGYTCRGRAVAPTRADPAGALEVRCVRGRRTVSFRGHA